MILIATVTGVMPTRVTLPGATTQQPATVLQGYIPVVGVRVVVAVLDGGATYVMGSA